MPPPPANLLIVDDEPAMTKLCARILSQAGYEVHVAHSAADARVCYEQRDGDIDLLLCDLVMPQEDGITLADWLLERDPALRVLFMTGYCPDQLSRKLNGAKPEPVNVMTKPFSIDTLLTCVERAFHAGT